MLLYKTPVSLFIPDIFISFTGLACDWLQTNEKNKVRFQTLGTKEIHGQPYFLQGWKKPRGFLRSSLQFFFASAKGEGYLLSVVSQTIFLFLCLIELTYNFYRQWLGELIEVTVGSVCVCVCVVCIIFTGNFYWRYIRSILWGLFHSHMQPHVK